MSAESEIINEAKSLVKEIPHLLKVLHDSRKVLPYEAHKGYQDWYSKAVVIVRRVAPARFDEFQAFYLPVKNRKALTMTNYTISDRLLNISMNNWSQDTVHSLFISRVFAQFQIFESIVLVIESVIRDIQGTLQAEVLTKELDTARSLRKQAGKKRVVLLRAAGSITGVVIERHLAVVAQNHNISVRKAEPTIGDLNHALREAKAIDGPTSSFLLHLGALRNLCSHAKERDPTPDDVLDLIEGAEKVMRTLY